MFFEEKMEKKDDDLYDAEKYAWFFESESKNGKNDHHETDPFLWRIYEKYLIFIK